MLIVVIVIALFLLTRQAGGGGANQIPQGIPVSSSDGIFPAGVPTSSGAAAGPPPGYTPGVTYGQYTYGPPVYPTDAAGANSAWQTGITPPLTAPTQAPPMVPPSINGNRLQVLARLATQRSGITGNGSGDSAQGGARPVGQNKFAGDVG